MTEDHRAICAALESARCYEDPYPHAVIDSLAPSDLFKRLRGTWPSAFLYPVPAERSLANPRRRHAWLNDWTRIFEINSAWSEIANLCNSTDFRDALLRISKTMGQPSLRNVSCIARICEEVLPYELKQHRDRPEKVMSFIWYIDGGPEHNLGTTLYGSVLDKPIESRNNSALCIPNTEYSFHGGKWNKPKNYVRRTLQVFVVDDDMLGAG